MPGINPRRFKSEAYSHLAQVGKALSNPVRLEILDLLSQAPRTVEVLAAEVAQSTANTSSHLQRLKRAHLVRSERDGLYITYSVVGPEVRDLIAQLQSIAEEHVAALHSLRQAYLSERDELEAIDAHTLADRLRRDDAFLIDVRPTDEFENGHLPGAVSVPLSELESHLAAFPRDRTIVAYCRGPFCAFSADAATRLRELGFDARRTDVTVGTLPTSPPKRPQP